MPELPEVETVARGLRQALAGATVRAVEVRQAAIVRGGESDFAVLHGARVKSVERAGKSIVITAGRPGRSQAAPSWQLLLHMGMSGRLLVLEAAAAAARHTHFVVEFENGTQLRLVDPRRFGRVTLAAAPERGWAASLKVPAGREALEIGVEEFVALFRRRAAIKNALLNQKLLRGIGNIYADESLHRAGLDPRARDVSAARLRRLWSAQREVLRAAVAAGGSSVSDYVASDGRPGWFQLQHRVYGRAGEPCPGCGAAVRRILLGGRSAHFCPRCQRR